MTYNFCKVAGVIGGTVSSILANLHAHNVIETVMMSIIGAVVSFLTSYFLEWIFKLRSIRR